MPTLYSSDMSSSTNRSKRSIRPPARFAKDGDGTENSSKEGQLSYLQIVAKKGQLSYLLLQA